MKYITSYFVAILSVATLSIFSGCDTSSASDSLSTSNTVGRGGSTARFAIEGNNLYAITSNNLQVFNIADKTKPVLSREVSVGWGLETIFPYNNKLFIGSQNGMYIYDLSVPSSPVLLSNYLHITACDPVVAQGNYAYVTLRAGRTCNNTSLNQLEVIDISNPSNPTQVNNVAMTSPQGLGVDGTTLFVCDNGLKMFDVSNPFNIRLITSFDIQAHDVITLNGNLLVIGADGLYQYSYTPQSISLLSKLKIVSL